MDTSDTPVFTAVADTHTILKAIGEREQLANDIAGLREVKTLKQLAAYITTLEQQLANKRIKP